MFNRAKIRRVLPLALVYASVWAILSEGDVSSWLLGIPAVSIAVWLSSWEAHRPARLWRPRYAFLFTVDFIRMSIHSGIDVALKALRPRIAIDPGFIDFHLRLPDGPARHFFTGLIGLLPGTLSARRADDLLTVHLLDRQPGAVEALRNVERDVARLFSVELGDLPEGVK